MVTPPKTPKPKDLRICLRENLGAIANDASLTAQGKKSLFFCQSRALAEEIAERMRNRGIDVFVHEIFWVDTSPLVGDNIFFVFVVVLDIPPTCSFNKGTQSLAIASRGNGFEGCL